QGTCYGPARPQSPNPKRRSPLMKHVTLVFSLALFFFALIPVHAEDQHELTKSLAGKWVAVAEESDGKRMKKADVTKMEKTLLIDGKQFVLSWSGRTIKGTLEILPDETPAAID